jgi:hypothetical protein
VNTYDCYVVLDRVRRDGRLVCTTTVFMRRDIEDWHDLVTPETLIIWLVERTLRSLAVSVVVAHLARHAPVGVTQLWEIP